MPGARCKTQGSTTHPHAVSYWEEEERQAHQTLQTAAGPAGPASLGGLDDDDDPGIQNADPSDHVLRLLTTLAPRAAIVYCRSRELVEIVAGRARAAGLPAQAYHAGLSAPVRAATLAAWAQKRADCAVVVATIAFGMGIDRADVDLVIHASLPKSLEGYYQESGRAGRAVDPARAVLLYSQRDRRALEFIAKKERARAEAKRAAAAGEGRGDAAPSSVHAVVDYCLGATCRRARLLAHFGERRGAGASARCCDVCDDPKAAARAATPPPPDAKPPCFRPARGPGEPERRARAARRARLARRARQSPPRHSQGPAARGGRRRAFILQARDGSGSVC